jgi:hypothetical protein
MSELSEAHRPKRKHFTLFNEHKNNIIYKNCPIGKSKFTQKTEKTGKKCLFYSNYGNFSLISFAY